jgi:cobalt-zinc-cadmium efflux system membrane fusion protein
MIKITTKKIVGVVVLSAFAGGAYWGWSAYHAPEKTLPVAAEPAKAKKTDTLSFESNAPQLAFLKVQPAESFPEPSIDSLNARLDYDDNRTARVFSPVTGRVVKIIAEAGDVVKAGAPLLQIDSPDFVAATADRVKADADLVRKKQTFERAKQLFESKGIAQRDLESAEGDVRQAEAEAARAQARLKNLTNGGSDSQYILRSPIAGVVSERQVNAGSEVRPDAAQPVFVVTNPQHLWVYVDLPEQYLTKIRIGQTLRVEVDAYPGDFFDSKVSVIGEVLDPLTRRVQVRCELENNKAHKLKAEMFARVTPISDTASELPRIPNSAIFTQGVSSFVFVELSLGQFQRRQVELSIQGREYSFVKKGLRIGEHVVSTGALLLNSELSGDL